MLIKLVNTALFSHYISVLAVLGGYFLQIIFMKRNSFFREKKYFSS
ncbi:hypothetical protein HMPREF9148_00994 [Prevotella sp. F0091]|nr:hypothetical protein HMPREF9148_00994 [Prevotella sp. F0091]